MQLGNLGISQSQRDGQSRLPLPMIYHRPSKQDRKTCSYCYVDVDRNIPMHTTYQAHRYSVRLNFIQGTPPKPRTRRHLFVPICNTYIYII